MRLGLPSDQPGLLRHTLTRLHEMPMGMPVSHVPFLTEFLHLKAHPNCDKNKRQLHHSGSSSELPARMWAGLDAEAASKLGTVESLLILMPTPKRSAHMAVLAPSGCLAGAGPYPQQHLMAVRHPGDPAQPT